MCNPLLTAYILYIYNKYTHIYTYKYIHIHTHEPGKRSLILNEVNVDVDFHSHLAGEPEMVLLTLIQFKYALCSYILEKYKLDSDPMLTDTQY